MTALVKPVQRVTAARRHEAGKTRKVVIVVAPPAEVGARLQGTRQTFWLNAEQIYELAVRQFVRDVEDEARRIAKREGIKLASARVKARRHLRKVGAK